MDRTQVKSNQILSVGYSAGTLEVEFSSGGVYQYLDVPAEVHANMMASDSMGSFLHKNVKPNYKFVKVPKDEAK